jgi:uncharacterized protein YbdZ (MbtH family)
MLKLCVEEQVDFNVSKQILLSMEEQWSLWEAATANF